MALPQSYKIIIIKNRHWESNDHWKRVVETRSHHGPGSGAGRRSAKMEKLPAALGESTL